MVQNNQFQQQIVDLQKVYLQFYEVEDIDEEEVFATADIRPIDDLQFVESFFEFWTVNKDIELDRIGDGSEAYDEFLGERGLTYREFKYVMHSLLEEDDDYIDDRVFQYLYIHDRKEHRNFIATNQSTNEDEDPKETYLTAIKNAIITDCTLLYEFFFNSKVKRYIAKSRLKRHVYIPAGSGSGKSEIIKYMFHELIKDPKINVNLLEPHQDLSLEVLQFSSIYKQRKRVIFLDPTIKQTARFLTGENIIREDVKFVINPFDLKHIDSVIIESLVEELKTMFFSLLDNAITQNMSLVVEACIETLLRAGHANKEPYSIADLKRFMSVDENADLIREGKKYLKNTERLKVMTQLEDEKHFSAQRTGVYNRLGAILGKENFRRLVVGKSTVDIGKAINSRKIIICNFSKSTFGGESSSILGKFFISLLQAHSTRRASLPKNKRPTSFAFVDECQRFLTMTVGEILEESRKYNLFMILANQFVGQRMDAELKDTILANTGLKIAGSMNAKSQRAVADEMGGITSKSFAELEPYQFFLYDKKYREMGTQKIKVPDYLVKKGRPFYSKKKKIRELLRYMVYESSYYIKTSLKENESRNNNSSISSDNPKRRKSIFNPKFDD